MNVSVAHHVEAALVDALFAIARRGKVAQTRAFCERVGVFAHAMGLRRRVAEENLAFAFPEKSDAERAAILLEHYRELGRVAGEYARLPELVHAPPGETIARIDGVEGLEALRGKGALLLSGHFGSFELVGAALARFNPVDFIVKPLSNTLVEKRIERLRRDAGLGLVPTGPGVRAVFRTLRAGRWVGILADQDARRHGVFVPFFGRLASTPEGPARLALATGAAIVIGTDHRESDGRHVIRLDPPYFPEGPLDDANVLRLTAWHTAALEQRIRESPASWFWLHRRWKSVKVDAASEPSELSEPSEPPARGAVT